MSYVDLHCHLLPGIDDGAATPADALVHGRRLHAEGVRDVACTPHIKRADFPAVRIAELAELRRRTQAAFDEAGLLVRLHGGGELSHVDAAWLGEDDLEAIAQGPAHARWLLLECPFAGIEAPSSAPRSGSGRSATACCSPTRSGRRACASTASPRSSRGSATASRCRSTSAPCSAITASACRTSRWRSCAPATCTASPPTGTPARASTRSSSVSASSLRAGATSTEALRLTQENPRFLLDRGVPALVGPGLGTLAA